MVHNSKCKLNTWIVKQKNKTFIIFLKQNQQLNTRSTTRDIDCVKSFVEKYGNFDEEPGTCSGWNPNPDERSSNYFSKFADCMIFPFDQVQNAETEEELCEPLEEISKCEAATPKCKNEFVGLAYGIAQVSQIKTSKVTHLLFETKGIIFYFSMLNLTMRAKNGELVSKSSLKSMEKL